MFNIHPTVKPLDLMRWLVRLLTPPPRNTGSGAIVLDPFAGSGTTGLAAIQLDRKFTGIDLSPDFARLAAGRLAQAVADRAQEAR